MEKDKFDPKVETLIHRVIGLAREIPRADKVYSLEKNDESTGELVAVDYAEGSKEPSKIVVVLPARRESELERLASSNEIIIRRNLEDGTCSVSVDSGGFEIPYYDTEVGFAKGIGNKRQRTFLARLALAEDIVQDRALDIQ